jgi:molecular chaperone DnaK (HSP70)
MKQDAWTEMTTTTITRNGVQSGIVVEGTKRTIQHIKRNKNDTPSGGMVVLLPSLIGVVILICSIMAKYGFRGRPSVCGIDLGTTNSVICVQEQGGGVTSSSSSSNSTNNHLVIHCIADPATGSPVVPSVVSFLDASDRQRLLLASSKSKPTTGGSIISNLFHSMLLGSSSHPKNQVSHRLVPDPSHVIVGQEAKRRIDSHPHHTLYHAKRVLGRPTTDPAVTTLRNEVEFGVYDRNSNSNTNNDDDDVGVEFRVPDTPIPITPGMVGSYVVHHLLQMTYTVLGHTNVKSAIICVPAKFNEQQRYETVMAFRNAGITVARIVEEPTAAALAYGLHRKAGVDYILVYDFGGGTLDISLLHVSEGYVDVMGSDGDDRLGGSDFDDVIAKYLLQERRGTHIVQATNTILNEIKESIQPPVDDLEDLLSNQCPKLHETPLCTVSSYHTLGEQLKISLSEKYTSDNEEITVTAHCLGISNPKQQGVDVTPAWTIESFCTDLEVIPLTLSSSEFHTIAQPLFDKSILPVERLLKDLNIQSIDIQEIVMVGGTTRMPQIRQLVQKTFPDSQMNIRIDPDLTVAYGAASVID